MVPFRFYLITDRLHSRHAPHDMLRALLRAGLRALQVREKDLPPDALFAYCRKLQDGTAGCPPAHFFLNDRADLALSLGFAGVHLREDSLPLTEQHAALKENLTFAVSTHHLKGVRAAAEAGAAFATFGPVFETASKSAHGSPVGLDALAEAAAATELPLFALGGVTPDLTAQCLAAGAAGVAAISAVWDAESPTEVLGEFGDALGGL